MTQTASLNLKEYLRIVSELECSVYRQENVIKKANSELVMKKPRKSDIKKPIDKSKQIVYPSKPVLSEVFKGQGVKTYIIIAVFGAMLILWGVLMFRDGSGFLGTAACLFGTLCIVSIPGAIKGKAEENEDNKKAIETYERRIKELSEESKKAKEQYELEMDSYKIRVAEAEEVYQKKCEIAKTNYDSAKAEVAVLDAPLEETKKALQQMYDLGIIFEKYRNMVAMTTMYEYFASGRCSRLEGADGAYNLYESELRQNLIINKLDVIISKLDQIAANQYVLYTEMKKTNEQLEGISKQVGKIVQNTESIAQTSALTAYMSGITAKNTAMIASATQYIALAK